MYTIEIVLKGTPAPLSVQRKELNDAEADYQRVLAGMRGETAGTIELSCERQEGKRLSVLPVEVAAVQLSQKQGGIAGGNRMPGFLAGSMAKED